MASIKLLNGRSRKVQIFCFLIAHVCIHMGNAVSQYPPMTSSIPRDITFLINTNGFLVAMVFLGQGFDGINKVTT